MVKADLFRSIEFQVGISHEEATVQFEQILTIIKDHLTEGDSAMISGFGQWKVRNMPARIGRKPKTKEEYRISTRLVVTFYLSKVWWEEISKNSGRA